MNKNFIISEEERRRILGIHENATKNQYLQIITEAAVAATPEQNENDAKTVFASCPCVTKQGWLRGVRDGIVYYQDNSKNMYIVSKGQCKIVYPSKKYEDYICENEEPVIPNDEIKKTDEQQNFKQCPCVTKMNWERGSDNGGLTYYQPKNTNVRYYGYGDNGCFKYQYDKEGNKGDGVRFNCSSSPFRKPAQNRQDIIAGKTLKYGDKSPLVQTVQQFLKNSGNLPNEFEETENLEKTTKNAIINFQTANKLKPDGVVGKNTWLALTKMSPMASKDVSKISSTTEKGLAQPSQEKPQDLMGTIKGIGDLATQRYGADKTQSPGQQQVAGQSGKTKEGTGIAKPEETSRNMSPF